MTKLHKSRTSNISDPEIDFRVLQFTSHDNSFLSGVGKHSQETRWVVEIVGKPEPVDVCVTVDKATLTSPQVHVTAQGKQVFPGDSKERAALRQDFQWRWPYRGGIRGLHVPGVYEVRPDHAVQEHWFAATLTAQMEDGCFKAMVDYPTGEGRFKTIEFPVVKAENIRDRRTHQHLVLPTCEIVLDVPLANPLHPTLSASKKNGFGQTTEELLTHFFARRSPPPQKGLLGPPKREPRVKFEVSKDRKNIICDTGYQDLSHFQSSEVRAIQRNSDGRLKKWWKLQIGPFAEHIVQLEKKKTNSKIVTLTVDGEIMCEAKAEDIESLDDGWECTFRFMGERFLDWHVHNCNSDGLPMEAKGHVVQRAVFAKECTVRFGEQVQDAHLYVDGFEFMDLPDARAPGNAGPVEWTPEALLASFGLAPPYKVDPAAPTGLGAGITAELREGGGFCGLFSCCSNPAVPRGDAVPPYVGMSNVAPSRFP